MNKVIKLFCFTFICLTGFGQNSEIKLMTDSLSIAPFLNHDTLDCSADLYWRIVAKGEAAIPDLVAKLTDLSKTNIRFHCKKSKLNVAEVCYFALTEISDIPVALISSDWSGISYYGTSGEECATFYELFFNDRNKAFIQQKLRKWFHEKFGSYELLKIPENKLSDCQKKYKIETYFQFIE